MFSFDLFPFVECFKKKYRKPFWKIIENYLVKVLNYLLQSYLLLSIKIKYRIKNQVLISNCLDKVNSLDLF